jgi:hypothetical protein
MLACRRAVELAKEMQVIKIILETDNTTMKAKLKSTDLDRCMGLL